MAGALGTVTIIKVDADTLDPLGGSCFRIMNSSLIQLANVCDNGPGDFAPDAGVIVADMGSPAVYYVQETQAPLGYALNPGIFECDATSDLLCSAFVGDTLGAVGGVAEPPRVAPSPLDADAPSAHAGLYRLGLGLAAAAGLVALAATAVFARRSR